MSVWNILKDRIQGKAPKGSRRSAKWKEVRAAHLLKNPRCELCGSDKRLQVHHVIPFHIAPDLELELSNLITLCESKGFGVNCHLFFGHMGNYRGFNPSVKSDVLQWRMRLGKVDPTDPL